MITKEYFDFFAELEKNNNKEWFDKNRKRYAKHVKEPFKKLVSDLITEVSFIDSDIATLEPKNAIFRINRDIRFSNDKTPYKTFNGAVIAPKGKKDHTTPGIYVELNSKGMNIYGGVWKPDKDQLLSIRNSIAADTEGFLDVINGEEFQKHFGGLMESDRHKRLPKHLQHAAEIEPAIYKKSFVYKSSETFKSKKNPNIIDAVMIKYLAAKPVADWLKEAMNQE
jgi:uncharacterized protein (TIGR02453 family)